MALLINVCNSLGQVARSGPRTNEVRQSEMGVFEMGAVGGVQVIIQYLPSFITAWTISFRQVVGIPAPSI